jgi:predicted enzyme related to lactoylglutathione lyase
VGLWFACDDPQGLHDQLVQGGVPILAAPAPGPFGVAFTFRDPFGYTVVAHEAPKA